MKYKVEEIGKSDFDKWDDLVRNSEENSIFHLSSFFSSFSDHYRLGDH